MSKKGISLIKRTVWPADVLVCLGTTQEDIFKYFDKHFPGQLAAEDRENIVMHGVGRTVTLKNHALILWTKEFPDDPVKIGVLFHEITHVTDLMLRRSGMVLSNDSDEAWAYMNEFLAVEIFYRFKITARYAHSSKRKK